MAMMDASAGSLPVHFTVEVQGFVQKSRIPRLYYAKLEVGSQIRWTKVRRATRAGGAAEIFNFYAIKSEEMQIKIYQRHRVPFRRDRLASIGSMTMESLLSKTPKENKDNSDFAQLQDERMGGLKAKRLVKASGRGIITLWIKATTGPVKRIDGLPRVNGDTSAPTFLSSPTGPAGANRYSWSSGGQTLSGTIRSLDVAYFDRMWSGGGLEGAGAPLPDGPLKRSISGKRSSFPASRSEKGDNHTAESSPIESASPRPSFFSGLTSKFRPSTVAPVHATNTLPDAPTEKLIQNLKSLSDFVDHPRLSSHTRASTDATVVVSEANSSGASKIRDGGTKLVGEIAALAMEIALFIKDREKEQAHGHTHYATPAVPREMEDLAQRYGTISEKVLQTVSNMDDAILDETLSKTWKQWVLEFDLPSAPYLLFSEPEMGLAPPPASESLAAHQQQASLGLTANSLSPTAAPPPVPSTLPPPIATTASVSSRAPSQRLSTASPISPTIYSAQPAASSIKTYSELLSWSDAHAHAQWIHDGRQLALLTCPDPMESTRLAWTLLLELRRRGRLVVGLSFARGYVDMCWAGWRHRGDNARSARSLLLPQASAPPRPSNGNGNVSSEALHNHHHHDPPAAAEHSMHEIIDTLSLGLASQDAFFDQELWKIMARNRSSRTCRDFRSQLDNLIFVPVKERARRLEEMAGRKDVVSGLRNGNGVGEGSAKSGNGHGVAGPSSVTEHPNGHLLDPTLEARISSPVTIILDGLEEYKDWVSMQIFLQTFVSKVIMVPQIRVLFTAREGSRLAKLLQMMNVERIDAEAPRRTRGGGMSRSPSPFVGVPPENGQHA